MKIGILTFHRAMNYGAVLQCYALYRTLSDMGHDVEVIDYRPSYIEKYRSLFDKESFLQKKGVWKKIRYVVQRIIAYPQRTKAIKVFDAFLGKHLTLSNAISSKKNIPSYYDAILFGSDQIWNPRICCGYDQVYWGQFLKGKTKLISYAASIGNPQNIATEQWDKIYPLMKSFDAISVRESKLAEYLQNGRIKAQTVLDPTLLASKDIFENIAVKPKESGYVMLYMLEYEPAAVTFAKKLANSKGLKLLRLRAIQGPLEKSDDYELIASASIGEFLGYVKYADYVVNVSFHGTAFSVIFNKNFYTLKSSNYERSYGLLRALGLSERFVLPTDNVLGDDVDYRESNIRLEEMRKESCEFISYSLNHV